jgi:tRNA-Thr(GGU) m(6)t(6)A37 methyltransferase TsaA
MDNILEIKPVAYYRGPFGSKFGIPRQSDLAEDVEGRIVFTDAFRVKEALRGLEGFSHIWLIWGFSENVNAQKHPTVRPPLLGGNQRVGVWASRSPFRPNNLGLSSVRIASIDMEYMTIEVLGGDLMDGTPIYDIKPYLPYADSHPEARGGFTDNHQWQQLEVVMPEELHQLFQSADLEVLRQTLALDPRPHYQQDASRQYGMPFMGYDIRFHVVDRTLFIDGWEK